MSKTEQCNLFEECEAPLCPLQENTVQHGIWYADEGICRARRFQKFPWVQKQKKIVKLGLGEDDGFFSVRMLEAITQVRKGITGANPDVQGSEKTWLKIRAGDKK